MTNEKNVDQSTSGAFMRAREIIQNALKERGIKGSDVLAEIMAERDAERLERARKILAGMNKDIPLLKAGKNGAIELDPDNPSHREWYGDDEDYDV